MSAKEFFIKYPVFRHEEFAEYMRETNKSSNNDINKLLQYHAKVGNIINIRRNVYASVINSTSDTPWVDPYLVAAKSSKDSILAYHSACELHGFAYTTFEEMTYFSCSYGKSFIFQNLEFKCLRPPAKIQKQGQYYYLVDEIIRDNVAIKTTSIERTIVDILDKPDLSGGWEEVWRSLELVPAFDPIKVINYALLLDNITTIAKVGYFLDTLPNDYKVDDDLLARLINKKPKSAHYIDKSKNSKLISKWNLMLPLEIINKTWEEPNEDIF